MTDTQIDKVDSPVLKDLRDVISYSTLESLKPLELDIVRLKVNFPGLKNREIAERVGRKEAQLYNILRYENVQKALEEAKWAAQTGVETAGDMAAIAEKDIIREFRRMALDATLDDKVRVQYGKLVLEHRAKLMKSVPQVVGPVEQKGKPLSFLEGEKIDTMTERMNGVINKETK